MIDDLRRDMGYSGDGDAGTDGDFFFRHVFGKVKLFSGFSDSISRTLLCCHLKSSEGDIVVFVLMSRFQSEFGFFTAELLL
ncbi:hypothetical protein AAHA92_16807 [Salvia divinorum]|uniref:Uncharacterized protein n=1 Tax=Salvia divinorum TaxID=28513 RepID=A0ABD1GX76_SALDI